MTERLYRLAAPRSQVLFIVNKQRGSEFGCEVGNAHATDHE
jgi:hypothetical protein